MISNHMEMLSPAARYVTISLDQEHVYAGQLRFFWKVLVKLGILEKIDHFEL